MPITYERLLDEASRKLEEIREQARASLDSGDAARTALLSSKYFELVERMRFISENPHIYEHEQPGR